MKDDYHISEGDAYNTSFTSHRSESSEHIVGIEEILFPAVS